MKKRFRVNFGFADGNLLARKITHVKMEDNPEFKEEMMKFIKEEQLKLRTRSTEIESMSVNKVFINECRYDY